MVAYCRIDETRLKLLLCFSLNNSLQVEVFYTFSCTMATAVNIIPGSNPIRSLSGIQPADAILS